MQLTSECHCSTGRNTNQTFQTCVIFVCTEKFSIQLQAAWHLTSNLKNIKLTHVISIPLTVDADTLNN